MSYYLRNIEDKILKVCGADRYDGVGTKLIDAAREFDLSLDWSHLEVGEPSLPRWQRTSELYTSYGFSAVRPRFSIGLAK